MKYFIYWLLMIGELQYYLKKMQQEQKCSQCFERFGVLNPPRIMPFCDHNICTKCLKQAIQHKQEFIECGFCLKKVKKRDLKLFPKNLKLLQKVKNIPNSLQKSLTLKLQKSHEDESSLAKSPSLLKQDDELLLTEEKDQQPKDDCGLICQLHNKPFEIICATEKKRICCHCAIFGDHKEHQFRTFVQFQNEIGNKTKELSAIQCKRQETQKSNNLSNLRKQLTTKFNNKKSQLMVQIQDSFNTLIEQIKAYQKSITQQAQQQFTSALQKINQQLATQMKLKRTYLNWESRCLQVVNKLKMTRNIKNKIQIYYDSPLEICQEGEVFLEDMLQRLQALKLNIENQIDQIRLKTQKVNLQDFLTLLFPILQQKCVEDEIAQIQTSFQMNFPSKILLPTKQDLQDNSFLFESQVSAIQIRDSVNSKIDPKNRLNKSVTSVNSIQNIQAIFGSLQRHKNIKTKTLALTTHQLNHNKERQNTTLFDRTKSPRQKRFGSPDTSRLRSPPAKQYKTPQEILIALASNDFINEIDLSDLNLTDREIYEFIKKAKSIRPVKAIKLQKNLLTDEGLQCICQYLEHVSNLNLSSNKLTDKSLQIIIRNKEYLYKMRIVNLAENKLTRDRTDLKIKGKIQELKKMGIIVNL